LSYAPILGKGKAAPFAAFDNIALPRLILCKR